MKMLISTVVSMVQRTVLSSRVTYIQLNSAPTEGMKQGTRELKDPGSKVITGSLHVDNKGACDWGYQGLIAYGCHDYVVIVDPITLQIIQTIGPTPGIVTHVRWTREKYHHAFATGSTYNVTLVTADVTGSLIVWDIATGLKKSEFTGSLPARTVTGIEWYTGHDASHDLLMVLRNPDVLELWDAYSGMALWKWTVGEPVLSFSLDPFDIHRLTLLSEYTRVLVVHDVNATKSPDDGKFECVSFTDPSPLQAGQTSRRKSSSGSEKSPTIKTSNSWTKLATNLATNILSVPEIHVNTKRRSISGEEALTFTSCLQATFSAVHRHIVVLLFPAAVHFLDVDVGLTVGEIRLDRSSPTIQKVLGCSSVDMLFCLHDNGSSSVRLARPGKDRESVSMEMTYDLMCQSEAIRLLRQSKLFGFILHPVTESQAGILLSDGRLVIMDVMATEYSKDSCEEPISGHRCISDVLHGRTVKPSSNRYSVDMNDHVTLKLVTSGLVSGLSAATTDLAMIPGLPSGDNGNRLLAIGNDVGVVQLLDVASGQIVKEYKVFMTAIRGLTWVDPELILTYTYPDPSAYGNRTVKSSFTVFSTVSGGTLIQQTDKPGVIVTACVSASRKMFAVVYEDKPIEIWNISTCQLARDIALSAGMRPLHAIFYPYVTTTRRKVKLPAHDEDGSNVTDGEPACRRSLEPGLSEKLVRAEQLFVCGSAEAGITRYTIWEDAEINEVTFSPEGIIENQNSRMKFSCIGWKKRFLVLCERSGAVFLTQVKTGSEKARKLHHRVGLVPTSLQFGPGPDNLRFLVMYPGFGVDIFNIVNGKGTFLSSSPSLSSSPVAASWTGPETIAMATDTSAVHVLDVSNVTATSPQAVDDGFLYIKEFGVKSSHAPITNWETKGVFCPRLLERKEAFLLKYSLQYAVEPFSQPVLQYQDLLGQEEFGFIHRDGRTIADRCYKVARLFGDEFDLDFWRLVKYTAPNADMDTNEMPKLDEALDLAGIFSRLQERKGVRSNLINFSDDAEDDHVTGSAGHACVVEPDTNVATALNVMLTSHEYKSYETSRLSLHNRRRKQNDRVKKLCASRYILQNEIDMAVNVLMETDSESSEFKTDWLKACLSCCLKTSDSSSISTIKLAATHMIAAGNITDGVELLCMIHKHLDACKYLISHGMWTQAVWIAKTKLDREGCMWVMCSYAEHLWNDFQRDKSVLIMMSLGQYVAVARMLCEVGHFDTAAMFVLFCLENRLMKKSTETDHVLVQFAKLLTVAGYHSAIVRLCKEAGDQGRDYLKDLKT